MVSEIDLPVRGMTCVACSTAVVKALIRISGVKNAAVNFATERAAVEFTDPQDPAPLPVVIAAIREQGYGVALTKMDFTVRGMTCAACVGAIERALGGLYGVLNVSVNLATEKATVEYVPTIVVFEDFKRVIKEAGYDAEQLSDEFVDSERLRREREYRGLLVKFSVSAVLAIPILIGSMLCYVPFLSNGYVLFALATPVQFWSGMRFHSAALSALRHGSTNMNTLISVGTNAAYIFSTLAIFAPGLFFASGVAPALYFDTSATIITLILLGRLLEARAKRKTSESIRKLMGLQAKTATVVRDGIEVDILIEEVA